MHPNEIDFTTGTLRESYEQLAESLGKKYADALKDQLTRQGLISRRTKLDDGR